MKQYTKKEFVRILHNNKFFFDKNSGGHTIYTNKNGKHISIPNKIACVIARRLIKENNLKV